MATKPKDQKAGASGQDPVLAALWAIRKFAERECSTATVAALPLKATDAFERDLTGAKDIARRKKLRASINRARKDREQALKLLPRFMLHPIVASFYTAGELRKMKAKEAGTRKVTCGGPPAEKEHEESRPVYTVRLVEYDLWVCSECRERMDAFTSLLADASRVPPEWLSFLPVTNRGMGGIFDGNPQEFLALAQQLADKMGEVRNDCLPLITLRENGELLAKGETISLGNLSVDREAEIHKSMETGGHTLLRATILYELRVTPGLTAKNMNNRLRGAENPQAPKPSFKRVSDELCKMRSEGLLTNRRGAGYFIQS